MNKKLIYKLAGLTLGLGIALVGLGSCAGVSRSCKSCSSDLAGGLYRTVNVYSLDGKLIETYEGKIDIDDNQNGSVMFDLNGKRYVYYNAIIEVTEK